MAPLVSVVIPTFNAAGFLPEAIASVLAQDFSDYEIVVVDDGSTDDTPQILARYGSQVRAVRQRNAGASVARNCGARAARGRYLAFLDSDDRWMPGKLTRQAAIAARNEFPIVHTDASKIDPQGRIIATSSNPERQKQNGNVFEEFFMHDISAVLTSTALIRRACFDEVGGFDETGEVVDDHDFFLRASWNHPVCFIKEPLVQYRILPRSLSRIDAVRRVEQHRATVEKAIKEHPEFFESRPQLVHKRWRRFNAWAGMMLYYNGARTEARRYLVKTLPSNPRVLPYLLLSLVRTGRRSVCLQ